MSLVLNIYDFLVQSAAKLRFYRAQLQNLVIYSPQCYSLKDVYVKAMIPPVLSSDVFGSVNLNQLSIWVPRASVEAYKEKWSTYKDNIKGYDF